MRKLFVAGRFTATVRVAAALALLAPAGCGLLFTYAEPPEPDAALPDASDLLDAATDAPEPDAAGGRVPCATADECGVVDGDECRCGFCVGAHRDCVFTGRAYLRTGGAADCLPAASKIDSAYAHTCVLMSDGSVWCWGNNESGQLGPEGPDDFSPRPVRVPRDPGRSGVADVAVGYMHSCALLDDGGVECWGSNVLGQLGADLDDEQSLEPLPVLTGTGPLAGIERLSTNGLHTCGLDAQGRVWCWGDNSIGQVLGRVADPSRVAVMAFDGAGFVASGGQGTCVSAVADQRVLCWGRDVFGALGRNRLACWQEAAVLSEGPVVKEMTVQPVDAAYVLGLGNRFGCAAVGGADEIWCWGENARHALGDEMVLTDEDGRTACGARRNVLTFDERLRRIVGGTEFACALYDNDDLYCWGSNEQSQLGTGEGPDAPPRAITLGAVLDVAAGFSHACAILTDGSVRCWGSSSDYGQVGDGTRVERPTPVDVAPFCP